MKKQVKKITTQNARTFTYVEILGEYKYVGLCLLIKKMSE